MIISTGPESSGTNLVTTIIRDALHLAAEHLSMPDGDRATPKDNWWNWEEVAAAWEDQTGQPTRFVVTFRRPDIAGRSAVKRGIVSSIEEHRIEWARAMGLLALIPDAYWLPYDALVVDPTGQIGYLANWLGVRYPVQRMNLPPKPNSVDLLNAQYRNHPEVVVTDENEKWLKDAIARRAPNPENTEWLRQFMEDE